MKVGKFEVMMHWFSFKSNVKYAFGVLFPVGMNSSGVKFVLIGPFYVEWKL